MTIPHPRVITAAILLWLGPGSAACACINCAHFTHAGTLPPTAVSNFVNAPDETSALTSALTVILNADAGLAANPAALAAFERGVAQWSSRLASPVTLTIDAGLGALGSNVIGSTSSVVLQGTYAEIRDQLVASASPEDTLTAFLPTAEEFSATVPLGFALSGDMIATKANLKAMGFIGLDEEFGASDATITFSSDFAFDYDNRDGVDPDKIDFETVVVHEIGHALGFITAIDSINDGATDIAVTTWDLFRFSTAHSSASLATPDGIRDTPRLLFPGRAAFTPDLLGGGWNLSTGLTSSFPGTDGRQASHWKDVDLTGDLIGVMNPTLAFGTSYGISDADLRLLDLIGWDVVTAVPEPAAAIAVFSSAILLLAVFRRRVRRG